MNIIGVTEVHDSLHSSMFNRSGRIMMDGTEL